MRKLLSLIVFCAVSQLAIGQNYLSGWHFGINGTYNTSTMVNEHNYGSGDFYAYAYTPAASAGINVGLSVNDIHEFQLEVLYSFQGQNFRDVELPNPAVLTKDIRLQYIKLPFVYKYKMFFDSYDASSPMHYFAGGIYTASLQRASVTYAVDGQVIPFMEGAGRRNDFTLREPNDGKELFIDYDFGMILGYGLEYPLAGDLSFTAELRAEVGLTDVNSLGWRFPNPFVGYRSTVNGQLGIRLGLVYNLFM